jgi:hypothetical protein
MNDHGSDRNQAERYRYVEGVSPESGHDGAPLAGVC